MRLKKNKSLLYRLAAELIAYSYPSLEDLLAFCIKRSFDNLILDLPQAELELLREQTIPREISLLWDDQSVVSPPSSEVRNLLTTVYLSGSATVSELKNSYEIFTEKQKSISVERARSQFRILKKLQKTKNNSNTLRRSFNYKPGLYFLFLVILIGPLFFIFQSNALRWQAEYFDNTDLEGKPKLIRSERSVKHNWDIGSPDKTIPIDNFSARWTSFLNVKKPVEVTFTVTSDDGVRVILNEEIVIDSWFPQAGKKREGFRKLDEGKYKIVIEYFERHASADIDFNITANKSLSMELSHP